MADPTAGLHPCTNCGNQIWAESPFYPICEACAAKESEKKAKAAERRAAKKEEDSDKEGAPSQQINPKDPATFSAETGKVNPNQQDKPKDAPVVTSGLSIGTSGLYTSSSQPTSTTISSSSEKAQDASKISSVTRPLGDSAGDKSGDE